MWVGFDFPSCLVAPESRAVNTAIREWRRPSIEVSIGGRLAQSFFIREMRMLASEVGESALIKQKLASGL